MPKILIVDDEKSIRVTFSKFLANEGYEVFSAENVVKALELIDIEKPDVVITDIIMHDYSGIDLLKKIIEKAPGIPVIMMTGQPSLDTATESVRFGAYDYLQKPVNKNKLFYAVKNALEYKKAIGENLRLEMENEEYKGNLEQIVAIRTKVLRSTVTSTISAISSMLELKDPFTTGHNKRVGNLAWDIAERFGLSNSEKIGLLIAGYLHDIGKISIPTEILSKPEKISSLEHEIVKTHVQCGYDILKKVDLEWPVAHIVYNHHERLDGSGYPNGVKGDQIEKESRILMVADVVEAMLAPRPYRSAHSIEELLSELENNNGERYDQSVVKIVKKMFIEESYKMNDYEIQTNYVS